MSEKVPKKMQAKYDAITALTDAVCAEHLNAEYADLARKLTAKLARKRPSPLVSGRANSWACGVVYALGQVNFLFDQSQEPHIPAKDLCALFGVAPGTGSGKAKITRAAANMSYFNADWMLPSRVDDSVIPWMISYNGFMLDARTLPLDVQVEAYQKGLISYVPGVDMAQLDALIKEHGYVQIRIVEQPEDESDADPA